MLNTVGNTDKEIEIVSKGIAVLEIGDELVNINGTLTVNDQNISSSDTLPIGAIVEYDGDSVPIGYEEVKTGIITAFMKDESGYTTDERTEFSNAIISGSGLSFISNAVVVGKGISKVKVSANFNVQVAQGTSAFVLNMYIRKNGNTVMKNNDYKYNVPEWNYSSMSNPPFLLEVQEGDKIAIGLSSGRNIRIHNDEYGKSYMTVEVVE